MRRSRYGCLSVIGLLLVGVVLIVPQSHVHPLLRTAAAQPGSSSPGSDTSTPLARSELAVQLRTSLEKVLGQHVILSARLVRSRISGDPSYVQAAVSALAHNTDDLSALIATVYGPEKGPEFRAIWESHEAAIVSYARALVDHDDRGRTLAQSELAAYPARMTSYLEGLTGGALPGPATETAIRQHISNQLSLADRVVAGDIAGSYDIQRKDYGELYRLATAIAAGVAGQGGAALPADFDSPQRRLDSALGELLGEHWGLSVDLLQAAPAGGKTLEAVGAEVNINTRDLGGAINVLFGPDAAARFLDLWSRHLEALVSYAQMTTENNAGGRQAALAQLADFERNMGQLLSGGTQGRLKASDVVDTYAMHDQSLLQQFDATARKDFPSAYAKDYEGYQHMFTTASALAGAIGPVLAARLPSGGVHTGGGGLAR